MKYTVALIVFLVSSFCNGQISADPKTDLAFNNTPQNANTSNKSEFHRKSKLITLSFGYPNEQSVGLQPGTNGYGPGPATFTYEYGISRNWGIQARGGFFWRQLQNSYRPFDKNQEASFGMLLGAAGIYYLSRFFNVEHLDCYLGFGADIRALADDLFSGYESQLSINHEPYNGGFMLFGGARYHLTKRFAVNAEAGALGFTIANLGLTYKVRK